MVNFLRHKSLSFEPYKIEFVWDIFHKKYPIFLTRTTLAPSGFVVSSMMTKNILV